LEKIKEFGLCESVEELHMYYAKKTTHLFNNTGKIVLFQHCCLMCKWTLPRQHMYYGKDPSFEFHRKFFSFFKVIQQVEFHR
jgi:hypothetical protein